MSTSDLFRLPFFFTLYLNQVILTTKRSEFRLAMESVTSQRAWDGQADLRCDEVWSTVRPITRSLQKSEARCSR